SISFSPLVVHLSFSVSLFLLYFYPPLRYLHSFPTRRSSDLTLWDFEAVILLQKFWDLGASCNHRSRSRCSDTLKSRSMDKYSRSSPSGSGRYWPCWRSTGDAL